MSRSLAVGTIHSMLDPVYTYVTVPRMHTGRRVRSVIQMHRVAFVCDWMDDERLDVGNESACGRKEESGSVVVAGDRTTSVLTKSS